MSIRKITSLTMLLSFVLTIITSIILYIEPEGRVAYWAGWSIWGLDKPQWGNLHINLGFLFLFSGLLHLWYNWKPLMAYMKKAQQVKVFTPSFNFALILTAVVTVGTLYKVPPMSLVLDLGEHFKATASATYGEPPYGHAELSSLQMFARRTAMDLDKASQLLTDAGIQVADNSQTVAEIAAANGITPKQLYAIIKPAEPTFELAPGAKAGLPPDPPAGLGRRQLADVCAQYGVDAAHIVEGLKARGIEAKPEDTIKDIAAAQGTDPHAFYEVLYEVSNQ